MKSLRSVCVLLLAAGLAGCLGPGRPPHAFLPPIAAEYYMCAKCGSLHGGIYGKGPLYSFAAPNASTCWHRWRQISRADFQKQAAARYPAEWAKVEGYLKQTDEPTAASGAAAETKGQ